MQMIILLTFSLFLQGALAELLCEDLPVGMCSFSIASSGNRCLLETFPSDDTPVEFQCKKSEVMVINMQEYIESDECVRVCGIDRYSVGISSDALLETQFTTMLCSSQCYDKCPNIIDLYYNLALAEGVILADLCKPQRTSSRRSVIQLRSLGAAFGSMFVSAIAPASSRSASSVDSAPAPM